MKYVLLFGQLRWPDWRKHAAYRNAPQQISLSNGNCPNNCIASIFTKVMIANKTTNVIHTRPLVIQLLTGQIKFKYCFCRSTYCIFKIPGGEYNTAVYKHKNTVALTSSRWICRRHLEEETYSWTCQHHAKYIHLPYKGISHPWYVERWICQVTQTLLRRNHCFACADGNDQNKKWHHQGGKIKRTGLPTGRWMQDYSHAE